MRSRAAELCRPDDPLLVEIANGLLEYDFEAPPDQPPIEPTVGLIEQVATAETERSGKHAGDIAYVRFTTAVTNASFKKFITGRLNNRGPDEDATEKLKSDQRLRTRLAREFLDYERLCRGFRLSLQKTPDDYEVSRLALELGYETNDKELARLGVPYFDKNPNLLARTTYGTPNAAYMKWAKAP